MLSYRQFHSSVYRQFHPHINLQAVPSTHQFTGSSTHTSIYRQFHPHINLQAVPSTHQFTGSSTHTSIYRQFHPHKKCMHHLHQSTGNSIHAKGSYTIHTNLQAVPYTIHTNLQVIPFTCSSILHADLQAIPYTNLQVIPVAHNPYVYQFTSNSIHKFAGYSSRTQSIRIPIYRHFQSLLTSSLYNLLLKIFTVYTHITNSSKPLTDVVQ